MINLPQMTAILIGIAVAVYLLLAAAPFQWERWAFVNLGFIPARYTLDPGLHWQEIAGPVTHQFLHGGLAHIVLNMVMLAAFGSGVERAIGGTKFVVLFLICGVAGALVHFAIFPQSLAPVVGASGEISGMFGAALRVMARQSQQQGQTMRLLPIAAVWIGISLIFGLSGSGAGGGQIAWAAHLGGFIAGLALFGLFSRGGPRSRLNVV